jgi:PAS domain S-box-containing protein
MATILIVDDRPTNRQFLLALLAYGGHRLLEAADGAEALALARSEQPDLVVTDILMPTMDGYEFVRQVRADPLVAATPVIFYSATYSVPEARAMAETCGVKTVLPKPSDPQVILDAVNQELGLAASDRTVIPEEQQVQGATELHELHRIGERIDTYLKDLHVTKELISTIVDRGDQLFKDRERLRPLSERFAENITSLQGITARLAALEELTLRLVEERSPGAMVQLFIEAATRIIGARRAAVCMLDSHGDEIAHLAAVGMDPQALRPTALDRARLPGSLLTSTSVSRLDGDGVGPEQLPTYLSAHWTFLGLSIRSGQELRGWVFFSDKLGATVFSPDDERIAVSMAAQLAVVYENSLLYDTVQRHAAQLQVALAERDVASEALRENELRFRQLTENITEIFFVSDPKLTQMLYVSPAYEVISGMSCESLYARPRSWADLVHKDDRERAADLVAQSAATGHYDTDLRILRPDGELRWIRARGFPILDSAGALYRVAGIVEDITRQRQADLDLKRTNRALRMLSSCNEALIRIQDEDALLQSICRIAVEIGGYRLARVGLTLDDADRTVMIKAHEGDLPDFLAASHPSWSADRPEGMGPVGRAIRSREVIVVSNLATEASLGSMARQFEEERFGNSIYLPLVGPKRTKGILVLHAFEGIQTTEDELELLRELANDVAFGISTIRARAEQQRADDALVASLKEKGALLKEVHHRVKNNLQVITSLLRLEARRVENPGTRIVLRDMQNRVHAMAALHERLYRSNSFAEIEIGPYIGQLVEQLVRSVAPNPEKITIQQDVASVRLGLDQAVPCGLLVTELVSNALKHAFPEGRKGTLLIELRSVDEKHLALRVCDDGIGLPEDFETRRKESLGLQLATDLSRQIGGTLEIERGHGTTFQVIFAKSNGDEARRLTAPVA